MEPHRASVGHPVKTCLDAAGAALVQARLEVFRLGRVVRRGSFAADGRRPLRPQLGPDATFTGVLQVRDPDAFAGLLARGIGRHRAFGFGMLLLRPAL
jgi:CRISPR system Cascade subunit CasE